MLIQFSAFMPIKFHHFIIVEFHFITYKGLGFSFVHENDFYLFSIDGFIIIIVELYKEIIDPFNRLLCFCLLVLEIHLRVLLAFSSYFSTSKNKNIKVINIYASCTVEH
jgi:hypothetical protein